MPLLSTKDKLNPHPEIKKLVIAWCSQMPYMAIWDRVKLAEDITKCFNKIYDKAKRKKPIR